MVLGVQINGLDGLMEGVEIVDVVGGTLVDSQVNEALVADANFEEIVVSVSGLLDSPRVQSESSKKY